MKLLYSVTPELGRKEDDDRGERHQEHTSAEMSCTSSTGGRNTVDELYDGVLGRVGRDLDAVGGVGARFMQRDDVRDHQTEAAPAALAMTWKLKKRLSVASPTT